MSDEEGEARARRAANRSQMQVKVVGLGDDEPDQPPATSAERIELLVELTRAAWAMTGQPWPTVPRAQWPGRVRNLGEEP